MRSFPYLLLSARKLLLRRALRCPSCGCGESSAIDRKYLVTTLRRCSNCRLLFRSPTTCPQENEALYQEQYQQGFTTEMPLAAALRKLLETGFRGSEKDYGKYIEVLAALRVARGSRVFDYGCSWGYGSWQLAQAGYKVDSFDISKPRANYAAANLGVNIVPPESCGVSAYDVFFSAHVIEHVPRVSDMLELGLRVLGPRGLFVAFTPNGGAAYRQRNPGAFHLSWGLVHPQLIDWEYLQGPSVGVPVVADSVPYSLEELARVSWTGKVRLKLNGAELLFVLRREP